MRIRSTLQLGSLFAGLAALTLLNGVEAIDQISRRGKYLFKPDGSRFYIKGIAYQEAAPLAEQSEQNTANGGFPEPDSFVDPLSAANAANCTRDLPNLQSLGVNTIRVYSVNASLDHDACMKTFSDAGIYVILDLALPLNGSINRAAPVWDVGLLNSYLETADAFAKYDNVLAFNIGNEVVTQASNSDAAPFIKAAARDVKAFLRSKNRNTLLSYASTDGQDGMQNWRDQLAYFLTCGSEDISIDLYGLNSYRWSGNSSYETSGYANLTSDFASLPIPSYLSEFGSINIPGGADNRPWTEVAALFSAPMTDTFSGGIAFQYFPSAPGAQDYSLTTISAQGQVSLRPDWNNLRTQYNAAAPPAQAPNTAAPAYAQCSAASGSFLASSTLPPTPDQALCDCTQKSAWSCQVTAQTANRPAALGTIVGEACGYLSQERGANCSSIIANGTTGVYGAYSSCTAVQRADWAVSAWYEASRRAADSCSFGNQARIVLGSNAPASAVAANNAAENCRSENPIGTRTPTLDGSNSGTGSTASTPTNTPTNANAASSLRHTTLALLVIAVAGAVLM